MWRGEENGEPAISGGSERRCVTKEGGHIATFCAVVGDSMKPREEHMRGGIKHGMLVNEDWKLGMSMRIRILLIGNDIPLRQQRDARPA